MKKLTLRQLALASQTIACLGIVPAVFGIFNSTNEARREEQKTQALLRLTAFPALDGVIQRDRLTRQNVEDATWDLRNLTKHKQLKATYQNGRSAYYGTKGLSDAGRHYEYLGVMVRLGYVEFEPIFEVVSFPDELWNAAEDSGFLSWVREENWSEPGKGLPDFWVNFEYLRKCYHAKRKGDPIPGAIPPEKPGVLNSLLRTFKKED